MFNAMVTLLITPDDLVDAGRSGGQVLFADEVGGTVDTRVGVDGAGVDVGGLGVAIAVGGTGDGFGVGGGAATVKLIVRSSLSFR